MVCAAGDAVLVTRDGIIAVYIMTNRKHGTLYIGVTGDLARRAYEHREGLLPGFSKTYGCTRLVWWERFELMTTAIQREKTMKKWPRDWKTNLIERDNPHWDDLYATWM
jgi:putative endonuclease